MAEGIELIEADGVLEIHIDRPDKKNALTAAMYRVLIAALADASGRSNIATVLVTGKGGVFSAGNDLADFMAGPDGALAALDFVRAIATFEKPIVAAVQGLAVGIGTTLLFHCDLVYAAPDARFAMPFVNLGLVPEAGSSLLAPTSLGYAKAAAMLLLGDSMEAAIAERAGLVTEVVPAYALLDHARAKAAVLAEKPPHALLATRRLMKGDLTPLLARIDEEAALFKAAMQSPEAREAFAAFFQKRSASFQQV